MKKKRDSSAAANTTTAVESDSIATLKALIRDHAVFFDNLVDRIPPRFYLSTDNQDKPWFQGLPKDAKQAAKRLSKENTKKSRRDRLDPELASAKTTNQVLKESLESAKSGNDSSLSGGSVGASSGDERVSVTYEELQMRLRKRLEELRAGRGGGGGDSGGSGQRREKKEGSKRKRSDEKEKDEEEKKRESERDMIDKEASEAALDIEFGKVKLRAGVDDGSLNKKKKKRKLSKEEELERAIKLEEAKKDPEKGEMVAKQHSWKAATDRAMGIKVHDNPKLLKESMRKEKKKHKKSVEKWKERVEKTESMKREKQGKRKENIQAKIDRKKQMKIEKREKKLMRPGFEGRKEGFVNGN